VFCYCSLGGFKPSSTISTNNPVNRASVEKEMAKPRMAKSAKITERNLDTARVPEQPSTSMRGTVERIISSPHPSQPEKAQIAVDRADHRHRNLRIENSLADEHGAEVKLQGS
jgi:hypothetical protein